MSIQPTSSNPPHRQTEQVTNMTISRHFTASAFAALTLFAAGTASAGTVQQEETFASATAPLKLTNWSVSVLLPQFDSSLGVLDSVTLTLFGRIEGSARIENLNQTARDVTARLQATLKLVDSITATTLVQTTPLVSNTFTASAFDGTDDFGGASGQSFMGLMAEASQSQHFTDNTTLARFTGPGSVSLQLTARGESLHDSSGDIRNQFRTRATGYATVTYGYHSVTAVPEPTTWALMLAGLGVVCWLGKRRAA
jgi:hypothetical protein